MNCPKCGKTLLYDGPEYWSEEVDGKMIIRRSIAILYCPCHNSAYDADTAREEGELIEVGKVI